MQDLETAIRLRSFDFEDSKVVALTDVAPLLDLAHARGYRAGYQAGKEDIDLDSAFEEMNHI